ncbi:MAG: hypothetical protein HC831_16265 [Chloroflexia bacterium]|nr:hypothetical protein [Chloroflexia bacterium]
MDNKIHYRSKCCDGTGASYTSGIFGFIGKSIHDIYNKKYPIMINLVSESLMDHMNPSPLNEMDPQTAQAASFIAGGIGVLLTSTGIAYLQHVLKKSDNKAAQN